MEKKKVSELLKNADREAFIDIIAKMSEHGPESEKVIKDWHKRNSEKYHKKAVAGELEECWEEARAVISEFNEYGGGPESDEEEACDHLWRMDELVKEHDIDWEDRVEILDEMLEEFYEGNSGFDDILIDVASSFCKSEQEQRYLADKLASGYSGYYRDYSAHIYKNLGDEEQFLQTKLANLRYGSDYIEVAKYYAKAKDRAKELEYIWKGLQNCSGRLDELIEYIAPVYMKEENDKELKRLFDFVKKTKWDVNIVAMAKQMYRYAGQKGDYASRKKMLLLILDTCDRDEVKKWFEVCKKELSQEDWQKEYEKILEKVRHKDLKFYLDICMDTGREKEVLKYLQDAGYRYDYWGIDYNQYFSSRLAQFYPDEIVQIYWREVEGLLRASNSKNYETAVSFLRKIKALMKKNKKQAEWEEKFSELKETHKRKRSFMALVSKL